MRKKPSTRRRAGSVGIRFWDKANQVGHLTVGRDRNSPGEAELFFRKRTGAEAGAATLHGRSLRLLRAALSVNPAAGLRLGVKGDRKIKITVAAGGPDGTGPELIVKRQNHLGPTHSVVLGRVQRQRMLKFLTDYSAA